MNSTEFLTALWGPAPNGFILQWSLKSKRSHYIQRPAGLMPARGEPDLYTGVGLAASDLGPHRRPTNESVAGIAGLWADIDVNGGPDNKTGACETWDDALETAQLLAEPTIIVHSGYGLQAWWLFDEGHWRFRTRGEQKMAARAAAQWQKLLRDRGGHGLDYTHDLARVLRLPGTTNAKGGGSRPVEVLDEGPRHTRDELLDIASGAGEVESGFATTLSPIAVISPDRERGVIVARQLAERSPRFARTLEHERDDLPSMSEYDLALASMAVLAGYPDQAIADLVSYHRLSVGDKKGERIDYIARTVARARQGEKQLETQPAEPARINSTKPGTYLSKEWAKVIRETLRSDRRFAIPLPFAAMNEALDGGIAPGDVVLVAGYTSHGKSVFVDMVADTAAADGKSVHLYLTEMTAYERGVRLLARRGIPFRRLRRRNLNEADWTKIDAELELLPYGCSIVSDWSIDDVVAHIVENKWDLAVVDLIHGFGYNDERELSRTSSAIVRAAKASAHDGHLGTAVVMAAHLNDGQMRDQRSPKRPMPGLHSIKGSSSLKQDADIVLFAWLQDSDDGTPTHEGAVWIAKSRNGGMVKVPVELVTSTMTFRVAA